MKPKSMKTILLAALLAPGALFAQTTAFTTPVGYYQHDGKAGGNVLVPSLVSSSSFTGAITSATATALTFATGSLTTGSLDAVGGVATHYIEFTSGPNQGVSVDIASNTGNVVNVASSLTALALSGSETVTIRKHFTLKSVFASSEAALSAFSDSVTFYSPTSTVTYFYNGSGGWTSDFTNADGNNRPILPGTGVVLNLTGDTKITIAGEVKSVDTVVQIAGNSVNIVGPINPLQGSTATIASLGFQNMAAFQDSLTLYAPGTLNPINTYFADGSGNVTTNFVIPSADTITFSTGGVLSAGANTALKIKSGL